MKHLWIFFCCTLLRLKHFWCESSMSHHHICSRLFCKQPLLLPPSVALFHIMVMSTPFIQTIVLCYIFLFHLSEENRASCWAGHVTKTFGLEATISAYFLKQQMNNDQIREDVGEKKLSFSFIRVEVYPSRQQMDHALNSDPSMCIHSVQLGCCCHASA